MFQGRSPREPRHVRRRCWRCGRATHHPAASRKSGSPQPAAALAHIAPAATRLNAGRARRQPKARVARETTAMSRRAGDTSSGQRSPVVHAAAADGRHASGNALPWACSKASRAENGAMFGDVAGATVGPREAALEPMTGGAPVAELQRSGGDHVSSWARLADGRRSMPGLADRRLHDGVTAWRGRASPNLAAQADLVPQLSAGSGRAGGGGAAATLRCRAWRAGRRSAPVAR
jgi:hypothetical protein